MPFLFLIFICSFQSPISPEPNNYCLEMLHKYRYSLQADSLGALGVRLRVTQDLINNDCLFEGDLVYALQYFYGEPNTTIVWRPDLATEERAVTFEYKLLTNQKDDKSSYGDKFLTITCSKDYRIRKFSIHTIDE